MEEVFWVAIAAIAFISVCAIFGIAIMVKTMKS